MSKILQIMPAPVGMEAVYKGEHGEEEVMPITCLALVYDSDLRNRYVEPFTTFADGLTLNALHSDNFSHIRVRGYPDYGCNEGTVEKARITDLTQ